MHRIHLLPKNGHAVCVRFLWYLKMIGNETGKMFNITETLHILRKNFVATALEIDA